MTLQFYRHPVDGPISGHFGEWYDNYQHRGIDYAVPVGTPVFAPATGLVVPFLNDGSFGVGVCLDHQNTPYYSLYAHLSSAWVSVGQVVEVGQQIGLSGATGTGTGPHLHWQVCESSNFPADIKYSVDPLSFLLEDDVTPEQAKLIELIPTMLRVMLGNGAMPNLPDDPVERLNVLDGSPNNLNMLLYLEQLNEQLLKVEKQLGIDQ